MITDDEVIHLPNGPIGRVDHPAAVLEPAEYREVLRRRTETTVDLVPRGSVPPAASAE